MLETYNIPFDEGQVLDAIFGKSKDDRWYEVISEKDLQIFPLKTHSKFEKILVKDFEKLNF
jgi:hypothetical protein